MGKKKLDVMAKEREVFINGQVDENGNIVVAYRDVGEYTWTAPADIGGATVLIVGGGGGGAGGSGAGGGGAGQVIIASNQTFKAGTAYALAVGAGGAGGMGKKSGAAGSASSFDTFTADGGGAGAPQDTKGSAGANAGGSGPRDDSAAVSGSGKTAVEGDVYWYGGHAGGASKPRSLWAGAGGGGALSDGGSATTKGVGCAGGDGLPLDITGEMVVYACGGGGGVNGTADTTFGKGGSNGVSGGSATATGGEAGLANTGTGGGGGSYYDQALNGGAGGSGVVVIRYPLTSTYAEVTGFEGLLDGDAHGATIANLYPKSAAVLYATEDGANWTTEPITFNTKGTHTIRVKISADGLKDFETSVTVSLTDEPGVTDGSVALVDPTGASTPAAPYATWATAANDLQTAIDAVTAGGTVYVANGTYALEKTLTANKTVTIRGFDRETGVADPEKVVLDGQDKVRCVSVPTGNHKPVFEGLKFYRGANAGGVGGGASVHGPAAAAVPDRPGVTPSFVNCVFENCTAKEQGAALNVRGSVYLANCRFTGNKTTSGSYGNTVSVSPDSGKKQAGAAILGCTFEEVQAAIPDNACTLALRGYCNLVSNCAFTTCGKVGVIVSDSANANAENTVIVNCISLDAGAPFLAPIAGTTYGGVTLRNCLVARGAGYGVVTGAGKTVIDNCTITGNKKAGVRVTAGTADASSECLVRNTIVWNNNGAKADLDIGSNASYTETTSSTGWDGTTSTATSNTSDPRFKDAANGDWTLLRKSPHVDQGTVLDWMDAATRDLAGNPRVVKNGKSLAKRPDALPDLGCYENMEGREGFSLIIR